MWTTEYTYDSLNRLTQEKITEGTTTTTTNYKYDKVGSLLSKDENGTKTSYSYNKLNQLVKETTNGVTTTYTYDENGSLILKSSSNNTSKYVWDEDNRLSKVTVTKNAVTSTEEYLYDYEGNRIQTTVNGSDVTKYLVDTTGELSQVIAELDSDNNEKAYYTLGQELISIGKNTKISYYCYDSHGNVRALTDENGKVTDTYTYNAYGELTKRTGTTDNSYLYCAQQYSVNTGLYYLRARYMNPETGSFISRDTYNGDYNSPITLHKYLYANANPITYSDPSGYMAAAVASARYNAQQLPVYLKILESAQKIVSLLNLRTLGFIAAETAIGLLTYGAISNADGIDINAKDIFDQILGKSILLVTTIKAGVIITHKALSDIKAKIPNGRVYQMAYVNSQGSLAKFGNKMNFEEALAALGCTGVINNLSGRFHFKKNSSLHEKYKENGNHWGIYAHSQSAAKALAIVTGCLEADESPDYRHGYAGPEFHGPGYYAHYHDFTHAFHIWYGSPIY